MSQTQFTIVPHRNLVQCLVFYLPSLSSVAFLILIPLTVLYIIKAKTATLKTHSKPNIKFQQQQQHTPHAKPKQNTITTIQFGI